MNMRLFRSTGWLAGLVASVLSLLPLHGQEAGQVPAFADLYSLVRSNVVGLSEADLNRAAVQGLLAQLQSQITLVTNGAGATENSAVALLSKSGILDGAYAFLRVGRVGPGLATQFRAAYESLRATNKLRGMVVDLRFAVGQDYAAAAETADLFFKTEQPLLKWGDFTARSTAKNNAIELPTVVLINHYTSGAAEALAAALRQADGDVLIGSPTAGRAYLFREFPLSNGQGVRVASGAIYTGTGQELPRTGVAPDIRITLSLEEDKAYFEDPFRAPPRPFAQSGKPGPNDVSGVQSTNLPRRRLNEAELVRMQREGMDLDAEPPPTAGPVQTTGPVITDPTLSRGLDLLKGLALALKRR
jgi:hypothetical protein